MLECVVTAVLAALGTAQISCTAAYSGQPAGSGQTVAVSLSEAKISSAGFGRYIGIGEENGAVKELFGDKAQVGIRLDVYSPTGSGSTACLSLADKACAAVRGVSGLSVTQLAVGQPEYDEISGMLHCVCDVYASAYLVRHMLSGSSAAYELEGQT